MTPRVSDERLNAIESKNQHRYGDSEIIGLCMDLRDARQRITELEHERNEYRRKVLLIATKILRRKILLIATEILSLAAPAK